MCEAIRGQTTAWLLDRVRSGDDDARAILIARVQPLLQRFAHGRVPQRLRHVEDTADLVQMTWLRVLEKLHLIQSREPGAFFAYLRVMLVNALRASLRQLDREPIHVHDSGDESTMTTLPANNADPDDWIAWEQSLAGLSQLHRSLVLMRFEFGMSFSEIGTELGESTDGVRMKLNRAISRMAEAVA
jgi:RNA polymerase sigma factor (sigma-70 family)